MPEALLERGQPLLELRGVVKNFGPVRALSGVNLTIPAGLVTALCGDNGAGKSVTIKIISGIHPPDGGELVWRGRHVSIHTPKDSAALGIATVYQDLALCDNLDIVQNMFLGREKTKVSMLDEPPMEGGAADTCRLAGHNRAFHTPAGRIALRWSTPVSGRGQGRVVELAAHDPRRAHRCARRGTDRHGPRAGAAPRRAGIRRADRVAQPKRRF